MPVCPCVTLILEKAPFSGRSLHQYILGDDLSPLNVALFENRSYFGEKASGASAVTVVIYAGTAQSLNGLACELLACGTLYKAAGVHPMVVSSLCVVAGLQLWLSETRLAATAENSEFISAVIRQAYLHMHTDADENKNMDCVVDYYK